MFLQNFFLKIHIIYYADMLASNDVQLIIKLLFIILFVHWKCYKSGWLEILPNNQ